MKWCCLQSQHKSLLEEVTMVPRAFPEIADQCNDYIKLFEYTSKLEETHLLYMKPYIATRSKGEIMCFVMDMANNLVKGMFTQEVGPASKVLVGTKGVGKTNTLKRACILVASKHKDVIVVYHEYAETQDVTTPLELLQRGIADRLGCWARARASTIAAIEQLLRIHKLRVMLILDEVESIYCAHEADAQRVARQAIDNLLALGSNPSGRFATILCGSSVALPRLLSGKEVKTYALSKTQPANLNESKFLSMHVSQPALRDEEVTSILKHYLGDVNANLRNVYTFFLSPNLRRLREYKTNHVLYFRAILQDEFDTRAADTLDEDNALIRRINSCLWENNKQMFAGVIEDGALSVPKVHAVNWAKMKPMVVQKWDSMEELANVQHLVDNGWFLASSNLLSIWPLTPATLLFTSQREGGFPRHDYEASSMLNNFRKACTTENVAKATKVAATVGAAVASIA